jgi:hypothetical protein
MKLISFDIEISKVIDNFLGDLFKHSPLGISCAAVASETVRFWQGAPQMTRAENQQMVRDLQEYRAAGYTIVTWNGCGFDFRLLAEESGMVEECADLAIDHVDLMLLVTFNKGWYLGLDKALNGAGIGGKVHEVTLKSGETLRDMHGGMAPLLWAQGEEEAVLTYLRGDVEQTLALAKNIAQTREIRWLSGRGKPQSVAVPKLLTVRECFSLPEPDVSWMDNPPTRESFVRWVPDWEQKVLGRLF